MVRFVLGSLLAFVILVRPKPATDTVTPVRAKLVLLLGLAGMAGAVGGIIFRVHQVEWLGIMLLLCACLRWSLPERFGPDVLRALVLLYWVHPLPTLVFGGLTMSMQRWAVAGAEWLLHAANVRVWADGFFLYTGFDIIGVPESCSGMRTSLTVLLCALGIGVLYRFRVIEMILLTILGLAQVLALNILRITLVTAYAPVMPPAWGDQALHDTLGLFLMAAIVLTQVEASIWQFWKMRYHRVQKGIASHELERPERATRLPRFWHLLFRWARVLVGLALVSVVLALAVYKSRPFHRETMRREVIDGLMDSNLEAAERAISASLLRAPGDQELIAKRARVQVMRRDFQGALATYALLTRPLSAFETTLKSWSLMAVGNTTEAVALIDALPEEARHLPGVAMVRAEYAGIQGDPQVASRYIVFAGGATIDPNRVRALYPFLARHEQWGAIAKSDSDRPYAEVSQALIAAHACLRVNDLDGVARTLRHALRQWVNDPRFLRSMFVLASRRPGSEWEDRFAASFQANVRSLDIETIVPYVSYCIQLSRPDLAWLAYLRLLELDALDPDVFYSPAQSGSRWMVFRRHQILVGGQDRSATIDLRPLMAETRNLWPLNRLWSRVPLAREISGRDSGALRERYLKRTLVELESRERSGTLSRRGELIYPSVLASQDRLDEAHARLDRIRRQYPVFASQVLLQHAEFYDHQKRWQESYEALREYYQNTDLVELQADLLMVNALLNLNMAVSAMTVAEGAARTFPGVAYTDLLCAAIWDIFGFKDQALFVLGDHEDDVFLNTAVRLSVDTGRMREAERLSGALGLDYDHKRLKSRQALLPVPAEVAVTRRWPAPAKPEELAADAEAQGKGAAEARSPFLRELSRLTGAWCARPADPATADVAAWRAIGRDAQERATALHRLTVLLARQQAYKPATEAARAALVEQPDSAVLHRILVALTEGDSTVVAAARAACPDDPEIWLAWLVAEFRARGAGDWAMAAARQAAGRFSPETRVRGGDFFLRQGMREPAAFLVRDVLPSSKGLVSADMLALRCALEARDATWAMECARQGIQNAVDPSIFYKAVVEIKTIQETPDADLLTALEYLKEHFPADPEWGQYLGHLYFQRGDVDRALTILEPLVNQELAGVRVRSMLLAAEAARVSGYDAKAVTILERALEQHPDQMSVLNNLVYNLVQHPETAPRARELLPRLLELGGERFAVLDTAAMVCLRNGDLPQAQQYMDRALALIDEKDYSALETRLNAAEVLIAEGRLEEAAGRIQAVRQDPRVSNFLDIRARQLMDDLQRRRVTP